jgi:hypothetical protein
MVNPIKLSGDFMLNRRALIVAIAASGVLGVASPIFAKDAASWDGTWSGTSSGGGRKTTVKISNGKVVSWTNNGFARPTVTGSVSGSTVKLDDNNGWTATMTMQSADKAKISASGIGNNGKPAKNGAVLTRR